MGKLISSAPLSEALNLQRGDRLALTGGGGKTSLLYTLARENCFGKGIFTTTTRMWDPGIAGHPFQRIIVHSETGDRPVPALSDGSCFISSGPDPGNGEKVLGLSNKLIESWKCLREWPILVIEADGAAGRPLKAPRDGEPVIPSCVNKTAGCIGLDSLGKPLSSEWVHRCDLFRERFCRQDQEFIDSDVLIRLILHPQGLFQNAPPESERWVILNKTDRLSAEFSLKDLLIHLRKEVPGVRFLALSLLERKTVIYNEE